MSISKMDRRGRGDKARVLVVDDEADIRELLDLTLARMGIAADCAGTVAEAKAYLAREEYSLCLTDMRLPDGEGLEIVRLIGAQYGQTPVAVITAFGSADNAVAALKAGAFDYLAKPVALDQLRTLIKSALNLPRGAADEAGVPAAVGVAGQLTGESTAIAAVREMIGKLARSQAPVYISGESGSGKELAARLIHAQSARASAPFVPVNCGAIPENLMESEFFGYRKGAFTGADSDRDGFFQVANGGTLFLDEVADLPLHMQVKLLRVLQENTYTPIGSDKERVADVRIVTATNENLQLAIKEGRFREDLYHRLCEFEIRQPSLAECPEDIIPLAEFFRERHSKELKRETQGFTEDAKRRMLTYSWPGNVRDLQNRIKRAVLIAETPMLDMEGLDIEIRQSGDTHSPAIQPLKDESLEKINIINALKTCNGHREQAAAMLKINPATLYRKMKKYGLN